MYDKLTTWDKDKLIKSQKLYEDLRALGFETKIAIHNDPAKEFDVIVSIGDIIVSPHNYLKKYAFYHKREHLKYVDPYNNYGLKHPFKVGVLSKKKVQAWLDYEIAVFEKQKKESSSKIEKIQKYMKKAEKAGFGWQCINEREGYYHTALIKNGIEMSIDIESLGYISKKIRLHYSVDASIESFISLSQNKYENDR